MLVFHLETQSGFPSQPCDPSTLSPGTMVHREFAEFSAKFSLFQLNLPKTVYYNPSELQFDGLISTLKKGYMMSMVERRFPPFIAYVLSTSSVIVRKHDHLTGKLCLINFKSKITLSI
jgi:hypothetical protein